MNYAYSRGVAIILAMLIVAFAATLAFAMTHQQQLRVRGAENLNDLAQAQILARAALSWAEKILREDDNSIDHLGEAWAQTAVPISVENGTVLLRISDAQGLSNLNNLANNDYVPVFQRVLEQLDLPPNLAQAASDWVDDNSEVQFPGGAEDLDYLSLDPPYRAANQPLTELNNLLRVKGFTEDALKKLTPVATALPKPTALNVNTASAIMLTTAYEDLSLEQAVAFKRTYQNKSFAKVEDFSQALGRKALAPTSLTVKSNYFVAHAESRVGKARVKYQALIQRDDSKTILLWRAPE